MNRNKEIEREIDIERIGSNNVNKNKKQGKERKENERRKEEEKNETNIID